MRLCTAPSGERDRRLTIGEGGTNMKFLRSESPPALASLTAARAQGRSECLHLLLLQGTIHFAPHQHHDQDIPDISSTESLEHWLAD